MVKKADIPRHIVAAALELAAVQGWRDTRLGDIAAAAKLTLAQVLAVYPSKAAIVAAFTREIDEAVVKVEDPDLAAQPVRDRLFDVIMRRFDALGPHKAAVRAIVRDTARDPVSAVCAACALGRSMAWMLEAARVDGSGLSGLVRKKGLGVVYLSVLCVWLNDDSEDMAKTMAALDRRLRRAENLVMLCRLPRPRRREAEPEAQPEAG